MNKEQKRYLKEIKALMPVYGKYEKRICGGAGRNRQHESGGCTECI